MFHGSLVALVTPMDGENLIDYAVLTQLIEWHIREGTNGLVILGSTGEAATVEESERVHLVKHVVHQVNNRIPVIVGTGSNCTQHSIRLTMQAMESGADAALLVVPYYNKPTQEGLYRHFKAIAMAVPIPQILYNVPSRTQCDLLPETVIRLAEFSNIVGIKEATGDISRVVQLSSHSLDLYSGDDNTALEFMSAGGKGWINVVGNIVPKLAQHMANAVLEGHLEQANEYALQLKPLIRAISTETNPIPVKWILNIMGLIGPGIRLPLTPLSESHHALTLQLIQEAGLLKNNV